MKIEVVVDGDGSQVVATMMGGGSGVGCGGSIVHGKVVLVKVMVVVGGMG